ncbi:MAG TPA: ABC transporter permease [Candidatus Acidoferrum sp.]|jgi:putative ABC transport system permease protein|nr:ABC transporter permease [Candidatus Acidoferrum sp.]
MNENIAARLRAFASRVRGLINSRATDSDFARELESHLELLTEDNILRGLSPQEAERAARLKLGSAAELRESHHDRRTLPWLESLARDIRFALRMLRKNRGFTAVAVLTLALGIGATTAIFTIVDGVVLKSLQYPDADRIVSVNTLWTDSGKENQSTTGGDLMDLRGATDSFAAFSYYHGGEFGVQLSHGADFGGVYLVDPDFFHVFAVLPSIGRTFSAQDAGRSAVISEAFAERNFGSVSSALGQTIGIEGTVYEIVGVMPPMFQFPRQAQIWAAVSPTPSNKNRSGYNYHSVARMRPGLSPQVVDSQLLSIANRLAASFPDTNGRKTFTVVPLQSQLAAPVRTTLLLLLAAVGLVLLIACANVANLMLARATSRVRELAVRAVLGAGRARLVVQLLSESLVLAVAAGLLGIIFAAWGTQALLVVGGRFLPAPLFEDIQFDWRVLAFACVASLLTSVLFGIAPAWQASRIDLQSAMKRADSRGALGGGPSRLRDSLVVAQIALSLLLAVGAGLLFRTLVALHNAPMGFRTEGILVTYASAPARTLPEALQDTRTFSDVFSRLRRLPGAISVAGAMGLPAGQYNSDGSFAIEGKQTFGGDFRKLPYAGQRVASPRYFETMGIPLLRGRDFDDGDLYDRPFVAIISESLARQNFPNEDPIGHRIMTGMDSPKWMTVVGIVGDVRQSSPAAQPGSEIYMPLEQHPFPSTDLEVVVRTGANPEDLIPAVQRTIHETSPEIAVKFTTMRDLLSDSIGAQSFRTALASIFAVLALLLALSGMYAVMSYVTTQRTSEFGLRSALGAQRGNIVALVLSSAVKVAATGVILGLLLSVFASRLLESMLFGVKSLDAATYAIVAAVILPIILLAAAAPAWRAACVDPMVALRHE